MDWQMHTGVNKSVLQYWVLSSLFLCRKFCNNVPQQNWLTTDKVSLKTLTCCGGFCIWEPSQKPNNYDTYQKYVVVSNGTCREMDNILATGLYLCNHAWAFFWVVIAYWNVVVIVLFYFVLFSPQWALHNSYQRGARILLVLSSLLTFFGYYWCFSKVSRDPYNCVLCRFCCFYKL